MSGHCMHDTGTKNRHRDDTGGYEGWYELRCCHCGATGQQKFTEVGGPDPEHGPFFTRVNVQRGRISLYAYQPSVCKPLDKMAKM